MRTAVIWILIGLWGWLSYAFGRAWERAKYEIAAKQRGLLAECITCKARFMRAENEPAWTKDWCLRCLGSVLARGSQRAN